MLHSKTRGIMETYKTFIVEGMLSIVCFETDIQTMHSIACWWNLGKQPTRLLLVICGNFSTGRHVPSLNRQPRCHNQTWPSHPLGFHLYIRFVSLALIYLFFHTIALSTSLHLITTTLPAVSILHVCTEYREHLNHL